MAVEVAGHVEAHTDAAGDLGERAERRPAVEDRLRYVLMDRDEVVEEPDVVEPGGVGHAPRLALRVDVVQLL